MEGAATALLVRLALALAGGVPDDGGPPPPDSGRRGNVLAAAAWLSPLIVIFAASPAWTE